MNYSDREPNLRTENGDHCLRRNEIIEQSKHSFGSWSKFNGQAPDWISAGEDKPYYLWVEKKAEL